MGKLMKVVQRAALDTAMSQEQEVMVDFRNGDEIMGFLADVSEDTFRFRGGVGLSYDDLGSVQVVAKGKTIKEKAREAWERELRVDLKWVDDEETKCAMTGYITAYIPYIEITLPDGSCETIPWEESTDIRFVGEPETKEEEIRRICDMGYPDLSYPKRDSDTLLCEATPDELGAENEELRAEVNELEKREKWLEDHVAKLTKKNADMYDRLIGFQSGNIPVGTAVAEAPESLLEKLEHAREYGYAVTVLYREPPGVAGAHGIVLDVDMANECINLDYLAIQIDSIQHVEIAYAQPETPEEPAESGESSIRTRLEDARLEQRWVTIQYSDGFAHTGTIEVICPDSTDTAEDSIFFDDGCTVLLNAVTHIEVGGVLDAPDETHEDPRDINEPEDIAKQRWGWRPVGTGKGLVRIDEHDSIGFAPTSSYIDSPAQKKLQAAAPELADRLREFTNGVDTEEHQIKCALFLRSLGVPNVALWYKYKSDNPSLASVNAKTMSM